MDSNIERFVKSIEFLREMFMEMDNIINPIMGISDWDDSVCIEFGKKKLLISIDGPYTKRLVMKSALIHASTDVVVKGGKPLFCLDALIGKRDDIIDMAESLKIQALEMRIPILGGNTLFEDIDSRCSIAVIGELLIDEPIRDSNAKSDDILIIIGNPIWGNQYERIKKAKNLFKTWYEILNSGIRINASKDVTKGGLIPTIYEMSQKSGKKFNINKDLKVPLTRNLDNFLLSVPKESTDIIIEMCMRNNCPYHKIGYVE